MNDLGFTEGTGKRYSREDLEDLFRVKADFTLPNMGFIEGTGKRYSEQDLEAFISSSEQFEAFLANPSGSRITIYNGSSVRVMYLDDLKVIPMNEKQYWTANARRRELTARKNSVVKAKKSRGRPPKEFGEEDELQLKGIEKGIETYEFLKSSESMQMEIRSLSELPYALICLRIASGLTQKDLASRTGVAEQQIQRYEATRYISASLERINQVAYAMGIRISSQVMVKKVG